MLGSYMYNLLPPYWREKDSNLNQNNEGSLQRYLKSLAIELEQVNFDIWGLKTWLIPQHKNLLDNKRLSTWQLTALVPLTEFYFMDVGDSPHYLDLGSQKSKIGDFHCYSIVVRCEDPNLFLKIRLAGISDTETGWFNPSRGFFYSNVISDSGWTSEQYFKDLGKGFYNFGLKSRNSDSEIFKFIIEWGYFEDGVIKDSYRGSNRLVHISNPQCIPGTNPVNHLVTEFSKNKDYNISNHFLNYKTNKGNVEQGPLNLDTYKLLLENYQEIIKVKGTKEAYRRILALWNPNLEPNIYINFQARTRRDTGRERDQVTVKRDKACFPCIDYEIMVDVYVPADIEDLFQYQIETGAIFRYLISLVEPINFKLTNLGINFYS